MKPEDLFYTGDYDRVTGLDSEGREALGIAFFNIISQASSADPDKFNPETTVVDYARTTSQPGRVRADDEWQPHQAESGSEARKILYDLGCPARPFSAGASEALINRGTDNSVPSDLSGLKDEGNGPATV